MDASAGRPPALPPLLGDAPEFRDMLAHVSLVAPLDRPVLVVGERGTGKELVAARINYLSPRWDKPFVKLNCAALAEGLLDSELFGHEAGAFTGAVRRRLSRFEVADGGTLFLDEIANASLAVQEKILRVIEYGSFERVGGNAEQQVDVRIVGATNLDLPSPPPAPPPRPPPAATRHPGCARRSPPAASPSPAPPSSPASPTTSSATI